MPSLPTVIPSVAQSIRTLFKSLTGEGRPSPLMRMSILYEIFARLTELCQSRTEHIIPQKMITAKQMIEAQYSSPHLSIEAIADTLKISTTYLRREFRAAYGISPIGHLKALRIQAAKHLLLTEPDSVTRIGERCGYASTSYFIQDFHRSVGLSPAAFRARLCVTP